MKKLLLMAMLIASACAFAQSPVVKCVPELANGYLLLNREAYPALSYWECDVWKYELDSIDPEDVDSTLIWSFYNEEDYFFFPDLITDIEDGLYLMDLRGYDENDHLLYSKTRISPLVTPINPDDIFAPLGDLPDLECKKNCNGKTYPGYLFPYAYDIALFEYPNGGSFLRVKNASYEDANGDPVFYYAYYDYNNYLTWCTFPECMDVNRVIWGLDGSTGNYTDIQGNALTGSVVAVRKDAGPWGEGAGLRAPELVPPPAPLVYSLFAWGSNEACGNSFNWFKDKMNDYGDFNPSPYLVFPELVCIPAQNSLPPGGYIPPAWMLAWLEWREGQLIGHTPGPGGNPSAIPGPLPLDNIWDVLQSVEDQAEEHIYGTLEEGGEGGGPGGVDDNISDLVDRMIITDVMGGAGTTIVDLRNMYGDEGTLVAPSISLPASLYRLTVAYRNGDIRSKVVEAATGVDITYEMAAMVDIDVSPSPVIQGTFTIDIDAHYTGAVEYDLLDFNGTSVYADTYSFQRDNPGSTFVNVGPAMPSGIIFHRFEFADGSVKTIESLSE